MCRPQVSIVVETVVCRGKVIWHVVIGPESCKLSVYEHLQCKSCNIESLGLDYQRASRPAVCSYDRGGSLMAIVHQCHQMKRSSPIAGL